MPQNNPLPGEFYRHFKGNIYKIIAIAKSADDLRDMVVYQGMYAPFTTYVRSLSEFTDGVDYDKYPEATDRYRFTLMPKEALKHMEKAGRESVEHTEEKPMEHIEAKTVDQVAENPVDPIEEKPVIQSKDTIALMMDFLDERSFNQKAKILELLALRGDLNDMLIDNMAAAIDVVIDEGPVEKRFKELRTCVDTRARYEQLRLRN